jgi:hypothetical protein
MFRAFVATLVFLAGALEPASTAETSLAVYDHPEVAPTKTSIYIGTVSMTTPSFARTNGIYESTYVAKVFPYFFYNETGKLSIEISDELLRKLERGGVIEFKGRAINEAGDMRRIEGKVTPFDVASGKLKVRVFVSKRIELIFNTTYRFPDVKSAALAAPERQAAGP